MERGHLNERVYLSEMFPREFDIALGGGQPVKIGGKEIPGLKVKIELK